MITFGKKCPACGSRHLVASASPSRPAALLAVRRRVCADCGQQVVCLPGLSCAIEHRRHVRLQMPPFFLVRIPGQANRFGRIRNLSEGGICFDSPGGDACADRLLLLDLYNCNDGSSLEQLPAKIVATRASRQDINGAGTTVINNCARFTSLNRAQKKVLRSCIARYGTVPAGEPGRAQTSVKSEG